MEPDRELEDTAHQYVYLTLKGTNINKMNIIKTSSEFLQLQLELRGRVESQLQELKSLKTSSHFRGFL